MTIPNTRKGLIIATAAIALTSGCSPSYTCQHDYGLSKGTADFSNCMVHEEEMNTLRAIALIRAGNELIEMSRPVYAPTHYCQGSDNGNGSFSATCN